MRIASVMAPLAFLSFATASASPNCRGCNLIDEGSLNQSLVGQTVYERGQTQWWAVTVVRVATSYPQAIYWRSSQTGREGWNDARSYYTQVAYDELRASGRGQAGVPNPIDIQQRNGLWATCYAAKSARDKGEWMTALALTNACCNSSAAKRFGTPSGICR